MQFPARGSEQGLPSKISTLTTVATLQAAALVSLAPWPFLALFAPMLSDGGVNFRVYAMIYAIWGYPVWLLVLSLAMWLLYRRLRYRTAIAIGVVMVTPAVLFLLGSVIPERWFV
jgi:uncharacterized membrane protein